VEVGVVGLVNIALLVWDASHVSTVRMGLTRQSTAKDFVAPNISNNGPLLGERGNRLFQAEGYVDKEPSSPLLQGAV
jgi:hypothetical protein